MATVSLHTFLLIYMYIRWFGRIFIWIHWTSIFKFITKIEQKQNYTTTPPSSSFWIWVKAGLRPHNSEILIVLCTGYVPLFSRIRIRLKTQASSQWTPPINLIGFCPCCWKFKLAELTAYELLVCSMPHGTKRSKGQLTDGIFGFNPNIVWFLNFGTRVKQPELFNWHHY